VDDSEQSTFQPFGILYLSPTAGAAEALADLAPPDRCELLPTSSAADGIERLRGRRVLVILFDLRTDAGQWEALAREFATPDGEAPVPLIGIGDQVPDADRQRHMEALGVVDLIIGEQSRSLLAFKLNGLLRMRLQLDRAERLARGLVESEAKLEILVHQQRAANTQLENEAQQRRRALAALAISESRLHALVDASGDCVWEVNTEARYTYASPNMEQVMGIPAGEVIGHSLSEVLAADVATRIHRGFVDLLRSQKPFVRFENPLPADDGRPRMLETSVVPLLARDKTVIGFRGVDCDITLRKEQEAELEQARRTESIGKLTGGITHDLNNLLTIVLGNLRLIGRELADHNGEVGELVDDTESAAGEAVDLVRQLSGKTARQPLKRDNVDLNEQISDTARRIRRSLGAGIECLLELSNEQPVVAVDSSRLHNALLNLALNARDAMEGQGRLMIETLAVDIHPDSIPEGTRLKPGAYAIIRIMDTGTGMAAEVLARATEPFFTTKPAGKGSGMGLSMVFGTVVKAGGAMRMESEPGEGTTVTLWLPLREKVVAAHGRRKSDKSARATKKQVVAPVGGPAGADSRVDPNLELPGGNETLLVADDDARIRRLTVRFLKELGYSVVEVSDGTEAKAVLESDEGKDIKLLFTDIVMPGDLDGVSLSYWVRDHRPGVQVLLSSGFGNEGDGHGMDTGDLPFLPKPFAQRALAMAVREVLDQEKKPARRGRRGRAKGTRQPRKGG